MVQNLTAMSELSNSTNAQLSMALGSAFILGNTHRDRRNRRKRTKKAGVQGLALKANKEPKRIESFSNNLEVSSESDTLAFPSQFLEILCNAALPSDLEYRMHNLVNKEPIYHPRTDFLFRVSSNHEDKVDWQLRDNSIFNLRFLHKFLNLSPQCFALAVNIADRFLARVKVKPKYMACLATASYLIAAQLVEATEDWPSPEKLVSIARCGGSAADLLRMESIIKLKLIGADGPSLEETVTPLHFLLELHSLFGNDKSFECAVSDLEICMCSVAVYSYRAAQLALCIARKHWHIESDIQYQLMQLCQLTDNELVTCDSGIEIESRKVQNRTPAPRNLVWNLSRRTISSLQKPSAAAQSSMLDTIREDWREYENAKFRIE